MLPCCRRFRLGHWSFFMWQKNENDLEMDGEAQKYSALENPLTNNFILIFLWQLYFVNSSSSIFGLLSTARWFFDFYYPQFTTLVALSRKKTTLKKGWTKTCLLISATLLQKGLLSLWDRGKFDFGLILCGKQESKPLSIYTSKGIFGSAPVM